MRESVPATATAVKRPATVARAQLRVDRPDAAADRERARGDSEGWSKQSAITRLPEARGRGFGVFGEGGVETPHFYTAGLFARFLIERHGLEALVDFLRSTDQDASFAQFAPIFDDGFGEPLDTAMSEFEGYPSRSDTSNRIAVVDFGREVDEPAEIRLVIGQLRQTCHGRG